MNLEDTFLNIIQNNEDPDTIKTSYYIIEYCNNEGISLTNLKLNKLLYFINIQYMLKNNGTPFFKEEFLAWRHGPVLQSVYNKFCYGIVLPSKEKMNKILCTLTKDQIQVMEEVLKNKAHSPAWELVEETHVKGGPWEEIYQTKKDDNGICRAVIPNAKIYKFYKEQYHGI